MTDANAETRQLQKQIENLERMIGEPGQTEDVKAAMRAQKTKLMAKIPGGYRKQVEPKETLQLHDFPEDGYAYETGVHRYAGERYVREFRPVEKEECWF